MKENRHPLDALGDPTRRAIVEHLRRGASPVGVIAEAVPVSRPAVSQHLAVLRQAGLVTERPDGTRRIYRLEPAGFEALRTWLSGVWDDALAAYAAASEPVPARPPAEVAGDDAGTASEASEASEAPPVRHGDGKKKHGKKHPKR